MDDNKMTLNDSIDPVEDVKPVSTVDINYENALQVLIEELEKAGIWEKNMRVKVAVKILSAKLLLQESKINEALAILMRKDV
jgi:hypothetical protein